MSQPLVSRHLTAGVPPCGGKIRTLPEDFQVEEQPAYLPNGAGEHLFLWIEKRGVDTPRVARALAAALGIKDREVSYAGLKDRHAITRQFFSVPSTAEEKLPAFSLEGVTVLSARRHQNKLRPGHLRGNIFTLRIREVTDPGAARAAFAQLTEEGLPNFFGAQRFGIRGDNAQQGMALLRGEKLPVRPERFLRKLYLSAAQSLLFNQALAARMDAGTWRTALLGDVLKKSDSGGAFVCVDPAVDQPRVDRFEVSPAGPLFGPKMLPATQAVAEAEAALLGPHGLHPSDFMRGGDETLGARRAYRVRLEEPQFLEEGRDLVLRFGLTSGSYASGVLEELLKTQLPGEPEEADSSP
ncbi:MAG: tRNA pseudouridine(13) synthase TruD [Myxococcota bacterium]|nr:tRNA pseudouridine(13) synthase TruD [Myxococcota bacterium]